MYTRDVPEYKIFFQNKPMLHYKHIYIQVLTGHLLVGGKGEKNVAQAGGSNFRVGSSD